jgi:hypothetical protein
MFHKFTFIYPNISRIWRAKAAQLSSIRFSGGRRRLFGKRSADFERMARIEIWRRKNSSKKLFQRPFYYSFVLETKTELQMEEEEIHLTNAKTLERGQRQQNNQVSILTGLQPLLYLMIWQTLSNAHLT